MQTETLDPRTFLYQAACDCFPGYQPEGPFRFGVPTVVARIPAVNAEGYATVISETRLPTPFFTALVGDRHGARLRISTGDDPEFAGLLHTLCVAFSEGRVRLTPLQHLKHTVGIGNGDARAVLCFEDPVLAGLISRQLRSETMDAVRVV